jgi:hypothetical protein
MALASPSATSPAHPKRANPPSVKQGPSCSCRQTDCRERPSASAATPTAIVAVRRLGSAFCAGSHRSQAVVSRRADWAAACIPGCHGAFHSRFQHFEQSLTRSEVFLAALVGHALLYERAVSKTTLHSVGDMVGLRSSARMGSFGREPQDRGHSRLRSVLWPRKRVAVGQSWALQSWPAFSIRHAILSFLCSCRPGACLKMAALRREPCRPDLLER